MIDLIASVLTAVLKLLVFGFRGMRQDQRREWWTPIPDQVRNLVQEREPIYSRPRHDPIAVVPEPLYVGRCFDVEKAKDTQCQVCGSELVRDLVSCCCCATLHHRDCWDYNRGCSTYGCRRRAA